jgi:hypothetical protein
MYVPCVTKLKINSQRNIYQYTDTTRFTLFNPMWKSLGQKMKKNKTKQKTKTKKERKKEAHRCQGERQIHLTVKIINIRIPFHISQTNPQTF